MYIYTLLMWYCHVISRDLSPSCTVPSSLSQHHNPFACLAMCRPPGFIGCIFTGGFSLVPCKGSSKSISSSSAEISSASLSLETVLGWGSGNAESVTNEGYLDVCALGNIVTGVGGGGGVGRICRLKGTT